MNLYRIIPEEDWIKTRADGKVPKCNSDKRAGHIHLNIFEDIKIAANKYFTKEEKPVVVEVDATDLEEKIFWGNPTKEKPWKQIYLRSDNIEFRYIKRFCYLIPDPKKSNDFEMGEFIDL